MDIATRTPKDTIAVTVTDPKDGAPTDIVITLATRRSPTATAARFTLAETAPETPATEAGRKLSEQEVERRIRQLVAECTLSWTGLTEHGKAIACTPAAALALYERYFWLDEQVQTAFFGAVDFFDAAATS